MPIIEAKHPSGKTVQIKFEGNPPDSKQILSLIQPDLSNLPERGPRPVGIDPSQPYTMDLAPDKTPEQMEADIARPVRKALGTVGKVATTGLTSGAASIGAGIKKVQRGLGQLAPGANPEAMEAAAGGNIDAAMQGTPLNFGFITANPRIPPGPEMNDAGEILNPDRRTEPLRGALNTAVGAAEIGVGGALMGTPVGQGLAVGGAALNQLPRGNNKYGVQDISNFMMSPASTMGVAQKLGVKDPEVAENLNVGGDLGAMALGMKAAHGARPIPNEPRVVDPAALKAEGLQSRIIPADPMEAVRAIRDLTKRIGFMRDPNNVHELNKVFDTNVTHEGAFRPGIEQFTVHDPSIPPYGATFTVSAAKGETLADAFVKRIEKFAGAKADQTLAGGTPPPVPKTMSPRAQDVNANRLQSSIGMPTFKRRKLVHFSPEVLDVVDPKFQGTGKRSEELRQGVPAVKNSSWYSAKPYEPFTRGLNRHEIEGEFDIIDLASDYGKKLLEKSGGDLSRLNGIIKREGYDGYEHSESGMPNVVRMLKPQKVTGQKYAPGGNSNFDRWFKGSKIVDEHGDPLVVHHGTRADFNTFKKGDIGFHFGSKEQAENRLEDMSFGSPKVMDVFLSIKNPYDMVSDLGIWDDVNALKEHLGPANEGPFTEQEVAKWKTAKDAGAALEAKGYDGITYKNQFETYGEPEQAYIAFHPEQIKSATDNSGAFSPKTGNILRSSIGFPGLEETIKKIVEAHKEFGGATFRLTNGENRVGQDSYAVSPYTGRSEPVPGREVTEQQLLDYAEKNQDLLSKPDHNLGTWYDEKTNQTYIDVGIDRPKAEAAELGRHPDINQKAIFGLKDFDEIDTGGTGEKVAGAAEFNYDRYLEQMQARKDRPMFGAKLGDQESQLETAKATMRYAENELGMKPVAEGNADVARARFEESMDPHLERAYKEFDDHMASTGQARGRWYDGAREATKALEPYFPELKSEPVAKLFRWTMNIFGNGDSPSNELVNGIGAWQRIRETGKIGLDVATDEHLGHVRAGQTWSPQLEELNNLVRLKGIEGSVKWLETKHSISELNAVKDQIKVIRKPRKGQKQRETPAPTSIAGEYGAKVPMEGGYIFGPKLGAYGLNKEGVHGPVTMDSWMNIAYRVTQGILKTVTDTDEATGTETKTLWKDNLVSERRIMSQAIRNLAKKYNTTPEDIQAIVWTHVIRPHFEAHGQTMKGGSGHHGDFVKQLEASGWLNRRLRDKSATLEEGAGIARQGGLPEGSESGAGPDGDGPTPADPF